MIVIECNGAIVIDVIHLDTGLLYDMYSYQEEEAGDLQILEAGMADAVVWKNLVMRIGEDGRWKESRYVRGEDQSEAMRTVKTV